MILTLFAITLTWSCYFRFFTKLNTAYARLVKNKNQIIERDTTWNVGDMCVAFIKEMGLYVRGQITSFTLPQCAQVRSSAHVWAKFA